MRILKIFAFFLVLCSELLYSNEIKEIAIINFDSLNPQIQKVPIKICLTSQKSIGKYLCYDLKNIIDNYAKNLQPIERNNLIIIAESWGGETMAIAYREADPDISKLTPFIIISKIRINLFDTVRLDDRLENQKKVDPKNLDEAFKAIVQKRIFLQMHNIPRKESEETFRAMTLIFPQDKTMKRWMKNIKNLKLYIIR